MPEHWPHGWDRHLGSAQHLYPWLAKVGEVQVAKKDQLTLYMASHPAPQIYHYDFDISL